MSFDFKKEYKEFYLPKNKPEIVLVPRANYLAVQGTGDPNDPSGAYQQGIQVLYSLAFTLKMSEKAGYRMEGFFDYVVPPLEGFWWQEGIAGIDFGNKEAFQWISVIRLPDFITQKDFAWAKAQVAQKKKIDCETAMLLPIDEGLCVQMMHIGPYDEGPASVARMDRYLEENGYTSDLNGERRHHEIYLSDARRVAPEKRKTVIRHPIRKKG